ncbi:MAG: Na+/H+ antiporter subunit E [Crenarchaeota archaeon]|nr:Na+/H+ antiporter subunit E [Thermoproteota archaeon]
MRSGRRWLRCVAPAIMAFVVYIVYTGAARLYDITTGAIAAVAVGALMGTLVVADWRKSLSIRRLGWLALYTLKYFFVHEVRAHAEMIRKCLGPKMDISPSIVRVPIRSRTGFGVTMVSIAITNTPGTVVVDLDEEKGVLYVHWLFTKTLVDSEAYREVAEDFDRYAQRVFE